MKSTVDFIVAGGLSSFFLYSLSSSYQALERQSLDQSQLEEENERKRERRREQRPQAS